MVSSVVVTLLTVTRNSRCSVGVRWGSLPSSEACLRQGFACWTHSPFLHNWSGERVENGSKEWGVGASGLCLHPREVPIKLGSSPQPWPGLWASLRQPAQPQPRGLGFFWLLDGSGSPGGGRECEGKIEMTDSVFIKALIINLKIKCVLNASPPLILRIVQ